MTGSDDRKDFNMWLTYYCDGDQSAQLRHYDRKWEVGGGRNK